ASDLCPDESTTNIGLRKAGQAPSPKVRRQAVVDPGRALRTGFSPCFHSPPRTFATGIRIARHDRLGGLLQDAPGPPDRVDRTRFPAHLDVTDERMPIGPGRLRGACALWTLLHRCLLAGVPEYAHERVYEDETHIAFLGAYPTLLGRVLV